MRHITAWIALMSTILLHSTMPASGAQVKVNLQKTGPQALTLSWPSQTDTLYRAISATNVAGPWKKSFSPILGDGAAKSIAIPITKNAEYFKLMELPLDGSLSLNEGQQLSGTVTIDVTALSANQSDIHSIGLWDIFEGRTNVLDYIDLRDPARRSFEVNTVHMRNGAHQFQLELVNEGGMEYSEVTKVNVTNALSVVSQIPTEFARYLEIVPYIANGSYSVVVKNDLGAVVQSTNRPIAGVLSTNGTIAFKDGSVRFDNNYSSQYFDYEIEVTPAGGTPNTYSFRSPTISSFDTMEGTAIAQIPDGVGIDAYPTIDLMMLDIMNHHSIFSDPFFFDSLQREASNEKWNVVGEFGYNIVNDYLKGVYGRGPSHGHFLCPGGADYLGTRTENRDLSLSTATLNGLSLSNRMVFVWFDGFNMPRSLLAQLTGITDLAKKSSRATLIKEGRRPKFVLFWRDTPFKYTPGTDITAEHSAFVQDMYKELWKLDLFGDTEQTIGSALNKMRQLHPAIMGKLGLAGDYDNMFIEEVVTHQ